MIIRDIVRALSLQSPHREWSPYEVSPSRPVTCLGGEVITDGSVMHRKRDGAVEYRLMTDEEATEARWDWEIK